MFERHVITFTYMIKCRICNIKLFTVIVQGADYKMQQIENSNFSTSADHKEMN